MTPSRLLGCVWRGDEGDCTSFECLHPENKKTVTPEVCGQCPLRRESHLPVDEFPTQEPKSAVEYVTHGVAGLGKAIFGIDKASEETIKSRWEICKSCEFFRLWQCTACGCLVPAKIRQISERCPKGRWEAENGKMA